MKKTKKRPRVKRTRKINEKGKTEAAMMKDEDEKGKKTEQKAKPGGKKKKDKKTKQKQAK